MGLVWTLLGLGQDQSVIPVSTFQRPESVQGFRNRKGTYDVHVCYADSEPKWVMGGITCTIPLSSCFYDEMVPFVIRGLPGLAPPLCKIIAEYACDFKDVFYVKIYGEEPLSSVVDHHRLASDFNDNYREHAGAYMSGPFLTEEDANRSQTVGPYCHYGKCKQPYENRRTFVKECKLTPRSL